MVQWSALTALLLVSSAVLLTHSITQYSTPISAPIEGGGRSMRPSSSSAHPVLSRADLHAKDHAGYVLFANPAVGALDTQAHPEIVGGRVPHKSKTMAALGRSVWAAARHYTGAALGWKPGQPKRSLLETGSAKARAMHTMAQREAKRAMHTMSRASRARSDDDATAPAETVATDDEQEQEDAAASELHVTYLVHFAQGVPLTQALLDDFHARTGLRLGAYFPHNSYVLVAAEGDLPRIRAALPLELVDWIGELPNAGKIVSPALHALMSPQSPKDKEEGGAHRSQELLPPGFALNVQLQPLEGGAARTPAQQQALAGLVADFLEAHGFDQGSFAVAAPPSFHNDLLILRAVGPLTRGEAVRLLELLSQLVEVHVIEYREAHVIRNEIAQQLTQSGSATNGDGRPIWARGIRGEGQLVGCADSGVDYDHCMFNGAGSPAPTATKNDALRRVVAYTPFGDNLDGVGGHGTHVAGSIVGNAAGVTTGNGEIAQHSGQAPNAKLYFQDIGVGDTLSGIDNVGDLGSGLFEPAYAAGARIHSNSWGSTQNTYTTEAQSVDQFIWQNGGTSGRKMLILVAAGNDGLKQGSVSGTVGSPATAKNILSVGASQTTTQGWLDSTEYTDWSEKSVSAAQQLGVSASSFDCCAPSNQAVVKEYCCEAYVKQNIQQQPQKYGEGNMADFSSRGPTADGRVKPEIVAPGQYIISARSDGQKSPSDQCSSVSNALMSMAGTSMATPTVAGNAALLRQYLTEGWYGGGSKGSSTQFSDPSAALMAALLINGAQSLTGVIDEYNDGKSMAPLKDGIFPLSVFQGFGRVTLDRSLWFADETRYRHWAEDMRVPVATGEDQDYCFRTIGPGEVKATMVYHDAPGQVGAGVASTNNLDLYLGPDPEKAVAGNFKVRRDTLNNAESALYESGAAGVDMFVKIRGINVPQPQQYYALVISGPIDPAGVSFGPSCATAAASGFAIAPSRFEEATDEDHFPLGPVVGGVVGGVGGLAILGALARFCWQRFKGGRVV